MATRKTDGDEAIEPYAAEPMSDGEGLGTEADPTPDLQEPTPKEEETMPDNKLTPEIAKAGCQFDAGTFKAVHGKKILVMITDETGADLLAISGQQDTTFSIEAETTEASTKDGTGEWVTKNPGQKSWNASVDGLWSLDDKAAATINKALKNGTPLCYGLYCRETDDTKVTYTPVRKGLAYPTSNEISAPSDDNVTYSINFEGTGEVWMVETATQEDIEAKSFTISND